MAADSLEHREAIIAALRVLDRHLAALNSGDAAALARTLHFPHYRLAGGHMQIWEHPERYLDDFHARAVSFLAQCWAAQLRSSFAA